MQRMSSKNAEKPFKVLHWRPLYQPRLCSLPLFVFMSPALLVALRDGAIKHLVTFSSDDEMAMMATNLSGCSVLPNFSRIIFGLL
jgi:hypothetical protein